MNFDKKLTMGLGRRLLLIIIGLAIISLVMAGCVKDRKPVDGPRVNLSREATSLRFVVTYSNSGWQQKKTITEKNFRIVEKNYSRPEKQREMVRKRLNEGSYPYFRKSLFVLSSSEEEKAMFDRLANGQSKGKVKIDRSLGFRKLGVAAKPKVANIWLFGYKLKKMHLDRGRVYVQVKKVRKGAYRASMEMEDIYPLKNRFIFYGTDRRILREVPVEVKKDRFEAKN